MNQILFRLLDPVAGARHFTRVLEAGCGTGYLASLLAKRYGWRMYPLDLGMEGLRHARSLGVGRLVQADIARLPFPRASFDAVLSMDVIVHFPRGEETRAMAELARVLSAGGLLALRVSALDILRSRHSEFAHERQRFTRRRLVRLAESCGIAVQRCTYANSLLMPAALAKFRIWEPLTHQPPASGVQPVHPALDRLLGAVLDAEAACIGKGVNFPLGQSLVLLGYKRA
ncbi:MAG TPA: class I SAM-dependent methyltransferase [Burkholderiales bacterium]|nr:class I SAM-dependent methyltransferase [Burkholderiales bacterium]